MPSSPSSGAFWGNPRRLDWRVFRQPPALGTGRIPRADSERIAADPKQGRRAWMPEFYDPVLASCPREIAKITDRIGTLEKVRRLWLAKPQA